MVDVGAGFTGSAGIALVLDKDAALWTDSRYFYQVYGSYQIDIFSELSCTDES